MLKNLNTNLVIKTLMYLPFLRDRVCELVVLPPVLYSSHGQWPTCIEGGGGESTCP